ncbi:MAG: hypothetical protein EOO99_04215 [Pedobacter sp.]|nr:MAG: hypothetical protein EOO99_04215 [Pedobacter sp.]
MRTLIINIYKAWYLYKYENLYKVKRKPDFKILPSNSTEEDEIIHKSESEWNSMVFGCIGVLAFLLSLLFNIYFILKLGFKFGAPPIHKGIFYIAVFSCLFLVYFLLFNVLRLKKVNYFLPENRPDSQVISNTWSLFFVSCGLTLVLLLFNL